MGRKGAIIRISAGYSRMGIRQSCPQEWYPRIDLSLSSLRFASNADDLNSQLNLHMHLSCTFPSFSCYRQGEERWRQCLFPGFCKCIHFFPPGLEQWTLGSSRNKNSEKEIWISAQTSSQRLDTR